MSDLDARIRERMHCDDPFNLPIHGEDNAIRAVLDVHWHSHPEAGHGRCYCCNLPYPCATVRVIAEVLGVTDG
jgi:hypothetical protein